MFKRTKTELKRVHPEEPAAAGLADLAARTWARAALTGVLLLVAACGGGDSAPDANEGSRKAPSAIAAPSAGRWTGLIPLSLVPAAAANLPNGKVLLWAAETRFSFSAGGQTYTTIFDPSTGTATETLVSNTGHNMFCPGTSNLPDGRLLVNGGIDSAKTSLYDATTNTWSVGATMNIPRGYQANCTLEDGSVFTLGGSWSGGVGNKNGEIWTEATGWRRLTGVPVDPMLSVDTSVDSSFGGDSHFWLVPAGNGKVFHAGPGVAMHWISTQGNGSVTDAGPRGDDEFSINGNVVMYEAGKLLKTGGAPNYEDVNANANSYIIDINAGAQVRKIGPMAYPRAYHNSVVLPNGQVMIVGGMTFAKNFTDNTAVLRPELFDPATETFTQLPAIAVGRTYHSVALLLPDARVLSAGGGLCGVGCVANHPDLQVYSPNYLFNADGTDAVRPVILSAPVAATHGTKFTVTTDSGIGAFSLVRLSSNTHAVNNDQRRVSLAFTTTGSNTFELTLPSNPGILLPGKYMLFAMNADGVPSIAKIIQLSGTGAPRITNPGDQSGAPNVPVSLPLTVSGATSFGATGLPPGLAIDTGTGLISGAPIQSGRFAVTLTATNAVTTTSSTLVWNVAAPTTGVQYVRLEALSEIAGGPWSSMAEFNLLGTDGLALSRAGWTVSADSADTTGATLGDTGAAVNAIDGNPATMWHTQWSGANPPPPPHTFTVNLGAARTVSGFKYLPRNDGSLNGIIAGWRFLTSSDGINWTVVASGNFNDLGTPTSEKTILFSGSTGNQAPTLTAVADQSGTVGLPATLALSASDPDGDVVGFQCSGLPPGLSVDPSSGVVSGSPTTVGTFAVTALASDGRGGTATRTFAWTVNAASFTISPVQAAPIAAGGVAVFNASSNGGSGTTYAWDFGDGSAITAASTSTTTSHAYAAPGLYTVTVTATSPSGTTRTLSFIQAIYNPPSSQARPSSSSNVLVESRAGANARTWLVNQDNDSVSVFDNVTLGKLAEVPVGSAPRTIALAGDGRLWVVNRAGASISVINPGTLTVVQTITLPRGSAPYGVAFAPDASAAYVALEATGQLLKLHPTTGAVLGTASVGPNPRHVSVSAASDRVFVARFVSPPLPGESTASVVTTDPDGTLHGGEVVVVTSTLAIERTIVLRHSDKPDSTSQGSGIPNYLAAAVISPDGSSAFVPSKQDNIKRGVLRNGSTLDFQNTVRAITSRIDLGTMAEDYAARIDHDNSGLGSAAVFHPTGAYLFVALATSRHVAVVDPVRRVELFRFNVGRAPEGLAVSTDGQRLYVNNFMDRTLGVFDLARLVNYGEMNVPTVTTLASVGVERLSAQALLGKQLFYDARDTRLARDAYISCASCHDDGGHDGRVWDFTGFGEGLRNTIALNGRAGAQGFLHWSNNFDEVQDFEGQIRTLAGGTGLMSDANFNAGTRSQPLGDKKAGLSADLDALAAYLASLNTFAPSPYRPSSTSISSAALDGKLLFTSLNCAACHTGAAFTNSGANTLSNIGTLKPSSGQRLGAALTGIDVPTLRDVWATAPYLHDGSASSIEAAIRAHNNVSASDTDIAKLAAYIREIGGDEGPAPVPGGMGTIWSSTVTPAVASDTDTGSVNLGVKFRSDLGGYITGIRFYKGSANTGTHVGTLWSSSGTQLASATFANETASGWQQVSFATPVAITANTVYVASYLAPKGRYAADSAYFASAGFDNAPLHALQNGVSGGNGVYAYAASTAFPSSTYQSTNYWVDVVFSTTGAADTTPPTVTATSPASGATGVSLSTTVTATFSEAMDAASVSSSSFELRDAASAIVPASVTYNASTRVATLTPSAALAQSAVYTATVRGGTTDPAVKDTAGNRLAANRSWSFTTLAADTTPPTLTASSPTAGSTGVALASTVTATFSEAIDSASIGTTTFELRDASGTKVSASVGYNASTRVATLTPSSALLPSTTYTATVIGGTVDPTVKDLAGNRLAASSSWTFTTLVLDTVPPTLTAVTPSSGATGVALSSAASATFSEAIDASTVGTATFELRDASNALVAATVSYNATTRTATLTPTVALSAATTYTATVRGGGVDPTIKDLAGNRLASDGIWTFTTASAAPAADTIWSSTVTPAVASDTDTGSVNLGVKFRSDLGGYITGIRFYKGSANTGTHVGTLWSSSGTQLASATFANETASGWQQVSFATPVAITANTVYVASYLAPKGRYAADSAYFASAGFDNAPLHALQNGVSGGNGVYAYAASTTFPSSTYQSTNYWVDVVFSTTGAADTTPPTVTATSPASGATGVSRTANITATFSEGMDPASINTSTFELRGPGGTLVTSVVTYSSTNFRATLNPNPTLAAATQYTVTVRGANSASRVQDLAGNPLAADKVWTFTTP